MAKAIYNVQLMDRATGKAIIAAGGKCLVVTASGTGKRTILNAITFASATNPLTPTRGLISFAIDSTTPLADSADLYIMAPGGQFVVARSVKAGSPTEIWVDTAQRNQHLILPFDISDTTHSVETDTGFDFTTGMILAPYPVILVTAADTGETLNVGLLSTESGGDADGLIVGISVAALGTVNANMVTSPTLGVLFRELTTSTAADTVTTRRAYPIGATAVSVTYTLSADTDLAKGFFMLPYTVGLAV